MAKHQYILRAEIVRDRPNTHGKHVHPCNINSLHFLARLNPVAITAKQCKKDPSLQILNAPEILYLARPGHMFLR
ncbi:hypothetical protein ACSZOO_10285 [Aeromonas hydrophila]